MENQNPDDKLQQAIKAINSGDNETGKRLVNEVLEADPHNEDAWLWLTVATTDSLKKRQYLHRVLEINPHNEMAKNELAHLESGNRSEHPDLVTPTNVMGIIGLLLFMYGSQEFLGNSNVLGLCSGIGGIALGAVAWWMLNTEAWRGWGATIANLVVGAIGLLFILNGVGKFLGNSIMLGMGLAISGIVLCAIAWWILNREN